MPTMTFDDIAHLLNNFPTGKQVLEGIYSQIPVGKERQFLIKNISDTPWNASFVVFDDRYFITGSFLFIDDQQPASNTSNVNMTVRYVNNIKHKKIEYKNVALSTAFYFKNLEITLEFSDNSNITVSTEEYKISPSDLLKIFSHI